jgi:thiol-disulfide isomerase/thioredoxin
MACSLWLLSACDAPPSRAPTESASGPASTPHSAAKHDVSYASAPPEVPVAGFVAEQVAQQRELGSRVLVYVGAAWCEPCKYFHAALASGQLNAALAGVHVIEFDLDKSRDALRDAGYASKLIPLFVLPETDGRASQRRIEGSIKGPEAVSTNLLPRLAALLTDS